MFEKFRLVLLAACLFGMGCQYFNPVGPIIQAGIYWIEGEGHKYYNTEEPILRQATLEVLEELKIPVVKEVDQQGYHFILAGDDDKFKIKVRPVRENITKLSIRVNTFGDKPFAELIYRHVDAKAGVKTFYSAEELNKCMETRRRINRQR